jgi:hypothetical protein
MATLINRIGIGLAALALLTLAACGSPVMDDLDSTPARESSLLRLHRIVPRTVETVDQTLLEPLILSPTASKWYDDVD